MKHCKRILALALSLAMVFSLSVSALAMGTEAVEAEAAVKTVETAQPETSAFVEEMDETPAADDAEEIPNQLENSWRYKDGKPIYPAETSEAGTAMLNAAVGAKTAKGIDISHWQEDINWAKTSTAIDYVIIGCGRVVYDSNNKLYDKVDEKLQRNIQQCVKYGVPMGFYIYSYGHDAKKEANLILNQLKAAGLKPADVAFPIYLDLEDSSLTSKSSKYYMTDAQILSYTTTFCNTITAAGYKAGVYANEDWWKTHLKDSAYNKWERWLARWGEINYSGSWSMWQYTSSGTVSGISGRVDMDYWYGPLPYGSLAATTPNLTSCANAAGGIQLKWERIAQATGYYVYRKTGTGSFTKLTTLNSPGNISYTDTTTKEGTAYTYYIQAYNTYKSGSVSKSSVSLKSVEKSLTRVSSPEVIVDNTPDGIAVRWSEVPNAVNYYVYRHDDTTTTWTQIAKTAAAIRDYEDTTAVPGTSYTYSVLAQTSAAKGGRNKAIDPIVRLVAATPTAANSTNATSAIKVSWAASKGATGYIVWRRTKTTEAWKQIGTASSASYMDTSAANGKSYFYAISAKAGVDQSSMSDSSAAALYLAAPDYTVANVASGIKVSWTVSAAAGEYRIYRKTPEDTKWQLLTKTAADVSSYTDKTVTAGVTYRYAVRACKGSVLGCFFTTGKNLCRLTIPAVTVSNAATGHKISWKKITGAKGYYVYMRASASDSWKKVKDVTSSDTLSYTYTSAASGKSYYYMVKAYNSTYVSAYKSTEKTLFLAAPAHKLSNTTAGIKVSWAKIAGAKSYEIYRRAGTSGSFTKIGSTTTAVTYTDKTAKKGTTYYYRVYAVSDTVKSSYKTVSLKRS